MEQSDLRSHLYVLTHFVSCPICQSRRESSSVPASTYFPLGEKVENDLRNGEETRPKEGSGAHETRPTQKRRKKNKSTQGSDWDRGVVSRSLTAANPRESKQ